MNIPHQLMLEDIEDAAALEAICEMDWPEDVGGEVSLRESHLAVVIAKQMMEGHRREEAYNQLVFALGEVLSSSVPLSLSGLQEQLQRVIDRIPGRVRRYLAWYIAESAGDPIVIAKIITFLNPKVYYEDISHGACRISLEF